MKRIIYLDQAATTPVHPAVVKAMAPFWSSAFGNPSSITKLGVLAKKALDDCRKEVATNLKALSREIFFTGGGTESNNLAIFGAVNYLEKQGVSVDKLHFITSKIEHSSVREVFNELERRGASVTYLSVNEKGLIEVKDLRQALKPNTALVSIGYANNEIGTIAPLHELAREIRRARPQNILSSDKKFPYFHSDASQAGLYLDLNTVSLGVDLMTLDGQKIYGPKGVGVLFKKITCEINPIIFGGGQEKGLRSGTENLPLVVGFTKALTLARTNWQRESLKIKKMRDYFWLKFKKVFPLAVLNGDLINRLPNNLNFSLPGIDPEFTVLCLDEEGIVASTKSACDRDDEESFVIRALGAPDPVVKSALRFTLGHETTKSDIDRVIKALQKILKVI